MEEINLDPCFGQKNEKISCKMEKKLKKLRVKKCAGKMGGYVREYCKMSSIQGIPQLVKSTSKTERIWWIVILFLVLTGSFYMVYKIFYKWKTTPVLISLATKELPINQIPFPAVTICPEAKISRHCLNYTYVLESRRGPNFLKAGLVQNAYYDFMAVICRKENHQGVLDIFRDLLRANNFSVRNDHVEMSLPDYMDFFQGCSATNLNDSYCQWLGRKVNCSDVLTPILTDQGLCYSFNMYDVRDIYSDVNTMVYGRAGNRHQDWNPDSGYDKRSTVDVQKMYPRRAFLSGANHAFVAVFLTNKHDINYVCQDFSLQGLRVSLHTPSRIPRPDQVFFSVGLNHLSTVAVIPSLIQTSKAIKGYDAEKRSCYFGSDRKLKYFTYYSQSNCNLECWTNYTINQCGCVAFYMPRDNDTSVCTLEKRFCLEDARVSYNEDILRERLRKSNNTSGKTTACHCLPLCSELTYNAEVSTSKWNFDDPDEADFDKIRANITDFQASAIKVFFKDDFFLPAKRSELYGTTDLISDIGGALGLITGFSLFSLAEIMYVLSVKLIENHRKYGNWAGPKLNPRTEN